jgi:hypothetical protein
MLLGFPLDYLITESIQNAIATFGKVMIWENDRSHLAMLLVKARVTNLEDVPHFIVVSESEGFQGQSWTVQCEILEQRIPGGFAADEDAVPTENANGIPPIFNFFGLGQPGQAPFQPQQNDADDPADDGNEQWAPDTAPDAAPTSTVNAGSNNQLPDLNMDLLEENVLDQQQPIPAPVDGEMEVIHIGPMSLDFWSSMQENSNSGLSVNQEDHQVTSDLVLALHA